jgi:hypothetical protein
LKAFLFSATIQSQWKMKWSCVFSYLYTLVNTKTTANWLFSYLIMQNIKKGREITLKLPWLMFCVTNEHVFMLQGAESCFISIMRMFTTWWEKNRKMWKKTEKSLADKFFLWDCRKSLVLECIDDLYIDTHFLLFLFTFGVFLLVFSFPSHVDFSSFPMLYIVSIYLQ